MKKAVCLLSGGMDSAVAAAIAKAEGYDIYALSFDYGQRHKKELECSGELAEWLGAKEHRILSIGLGALGGSALTSGAEVPTAKGYDEIKSSKEIPATYVPARNTIFLSYALAYAEVLDAQAVYIGANCMDYSGYPDCRPEYLEKFQELADLATRRGVAGERIKIEAPLIRMSKEEIVKKAVELKVPLECTWSCYKGGALACGRCESCVLRLKGFEGAGIRDPLGYESD